MGKFSGNRPKDLRDYALKKKTKHHQQNLMACPYYRKAATVIYEIKLANEG